MSDGEGEFEYLFDGDDEPLQFPSKDGRAVAKYPNGDEYEGEFVSGKRHGKGTYRYGGAGDEPRSVYEGEWVEGKKQGTGELRYPDGGRYVGGFEGNERSGQGTYFYTNGDRYCGQWKADRRHGHGTYVFGASCSHITGDWEEGRCLRGAWHHYDGTVVVPAVINEDGTLSGAAVCKLAAAGVEEAGVYRNGMFKSNGKALAALLGVSSE